MVVRRVGVLSLAKLQGALSAPMGLIIGAFYALFFSVSRRVWLRFGGEYGEGVTAGVVSLLFGVGSIVFSQSSSG